MIVYGSRMYFKKNAVKHYGECEHCGRYAKQTSYQARKFGHIYFIPLIPMGSSSQILNECSKCNMGTHIPMTQAEPMIAQLKDEFKDCVTAIQDGQRETTLAGDSEPVSLALTVADTADSLYCLNEISDFGSISQILCDCGMEFENHLLMGRWNEVTGDLQQAIASYERAFAMEPGKSFVVIRIALAKRRAGDLEGAVTELKRYLQKEPDSLGGHIEIASNYEALKDYENIVQSYDQIYRIEPSLVSNKAMKKVYRKACKKSGTQGRYVDQM